MVRPSTHIGTRSLSAKEVCLLKRFFWMLIAILIFGAFYANVEFDITVDGVSQTATLYTSLAQLCEQFSFVKAGNYLAVDGSIITPEEGSAFTATVNGTILSPEEASTYNVRPGDTIVFSDGIDITEPYKVLAEEAIEPKMERVGEVGSVSYVAMWPQEGKQEIRYGYISEKNVEIETVPAQNAVIVTKNIHPQDGEKVVALTFDDGPSEYTLRYLDILSEYGAYATFFELGLKIKGKADIIHALKDAGMQIGTHSFGHEEARKLSQKDLQNTLKQGIEILRDEADVVTSMLRPPYGDFTRESWLNSGGLLSSTITWTQDSQDWERPGADKIYEHALTNIQPGSIILMHDGGGNRDQDLQALPYILQALKDQGYRVVTVAELLATDSSIPQDVAEGTATMPKDSVWPTEFTY